MIADIRSAASRVLAGPLSGIMGPVFSALESAKQTEVQVQQVFTLASRTLAPLTNPIALRPPTQWPAPFPAPTPILNNLGDSLKAIGPAIQTVTTSLDQAQRMIPVPDTLPAEGPHVPEPVFVNSWGNKLDATAEKLGGKVENWFNQAQSLVENSTKMIDVQGILREAGLLLGIADPAGKGRAQGLLMDARKLVLDNSSLLARLDEIFSLTVSGAPEGNDSARHQLAELERSLGSNARRDLLQAQYMMSQARRLMSVMNQLMRILMAQQRSTMLLVR